MGAVASIGGTLFILQQLAGINGVLYFSSLTFQDVGISSSALASLFVGLTNFAGLGSTEYHILILLLITVFFFTDKCLLLCYALVFRCSMCIILDGQARETSSSGWKLPRNGNYVHHTMCKGTVIGLT